LPNTARSQSFGALGLAIFSAIATARTNRLLATGSPPLGALTSVFSKRRFVNDQRMTNAHCGLL
jgi:hypothetical protein